MTYINDIKNILSQARQQVYVAINSAMVEAYWRIGERIVLEEQNGKNRAEYGKEVIKNISEELTKEFGRGFSVTNIQQMRVFYLVYQKRQTVSAVSENQIQQTVSAKFSLTWSHYLKLMRIEDENERKFYEIEAIKNKWSLREMSRQFDSALYSRLALSRDKSQVLELSEKGLVIEQPKDLVKDPYILEFLGLPEKEQYSENQLEAEIINKLEHFLLELGTGFTFVARQQRITFDEKHFYIDLVFYNRLLKCFVLIDLKIGELKHQDIGQMQMYVNYYDRKMKLDDESKTIGIILCRDKNESIVEYTLPENNEQIFASKYKTILPSKDEFKSLIDK